MVKISDCNNSSEILGFSCLSKPEESNCQCICKVDHSERHNVSQNIHYRKACGSGSTHRSFKTLLTPTSLELATCNQFNHFVTTNSKLIGYFSFEPLMWRAALPEFLLDTKPPSLIEIALTGNRTERRVETRNISTVTGSSALAKLHS